MQSIILYGSDTKLTNAHKPVHHKTSPSPHGAKPQPHFYVRMKVFNGDVERALAAARPMDGETVLNTIPISI